MPISLFLSPIRFERCKHLQQTFKKSAPLLLKNGIKTQIKLTPKWLLSGLMQSQFNQALKQQLNEGYFDFLENKWLKIVIPDIDFSWLITLKNQQLMVNIDDESSMFEAQMKGNLEELLKILTQQIDADTLFFQRKLLIEGDTEFALEVKNTLDSIDLSELPKPYSRSLQKVGDMMKHFSI